MSGSRRGIPWVDVLITAVAPTLWGSTYIVTTELLPPDRPLTAAVLRLLPAGLLLVAYSRARPPAGGWLRLLVLAVLNLSIFQSMLFVAAYRLPGGLAAVVAAIQPLFIMLIARMADGARAQRLAVWSAVLGVAGMALLLLSPSSKWDPVGIAAALTGALSMAGGTYLARRWPLGMPVLSFTGWQLTLGGLSLIPLALWLDPPFPALTPVELGGYAYLSLGGSLLAYVLWFRGVARLTPVAASSIGLLSPVAAVLLGWFLLGQTMTGLPLLGLVSVLVSILGVQWASARQTN